MIMKTLKTLLLSGALALAAGPAGAQQLLLSAGYNGTNVQRAGDEGWAGRGGYQFGIDVNIGNRWFVQPGIHFLVRNIRFTYVDASGLPPAEYRYTTQSLRIPLHIGINALDPKEDHGWNLSIMGGPSALIGIKSKIDNDQLEVSTRGTQWYLGAAGEVQVRFVFLRAGYDLALTDEFDGPAFQTNPKANFYHISAGVRLKLAD